MKKEMLQNKRDETGRMQDTAASLMIDAQVEELSLEEDVADRSKPDESARDIKKWLKDHTDLWKIIVPIECAAFILLIVIITVMTGDGQKSPETKEAFVSSSPRQEAVTEADVLPDSKNSPEKETQETATSQAAAEIAGYEIQLREAEEKYQMLLKAVFGETGEKASLGSVTAVSGFTDREKREIGFLEADFLKDAGAFLAKQQIQTKRIIIEDRIASSSDTGVAFQGRLEGKDDYILDIVFYPEIPGEYVFLLRNVKGNERGTEGNSSSNTQGQSQDQNASQAQETTQPAVTPQTTETVQRPQNTYDAASLSVRSIPETLLNYIDNRYEFQYSLYDYLYNNGKRDIGTASVTDYSIDGDARSASIELTLSDGSNVTAVYDKESNTYSFER